MVITGATGFTDQDMQGVNISYAGPAWKMGDINPDEPGNVVPTTVYPSYPQISPFGELGNIEPLGFIQYELNEGAYT